MTAVTLPQVVGFIPPYDLQESNEYRYCRHHLRKHLEEELWEHPSNEAKVRHGVLLLEHWLSQDYYESKNIRLAQLKNLDLDRLVRDIFISIAQIPNRETFVSATAQIARHLDFDDRTSAITTIAEITAVLCETDAFDIIKESARASLQIENRLQLSNHAVAAINRAMFPLPMVCPPRLLRTNFESGYLSFNNSVLLGRANSYSEDVCLDVINTQNQIELRLDTEFLSTVEELPSHQLDTVEKEQNWAQFKQESYGVYHLIAQQGNAFYLTNKWDTRGRMYCVGYHVTTQGTPFKKAMIELAHTEIVEGVPPNA